MDRENKKEAFEITFEFKSKDFKQKYKDYCKTTFPQVSKPNKSNNQRESAYTGAELTSHMGPYHIL